ncbi:Eaa protein [Escherichia coli]|nr:Eaa protein [Escherichia coli]HAL1556798.1 Eaa protein [Escherichia coli]
MTTITKDRLLTIKQWRETYGPGSNVVLPAEEAEELARIALASLEAKPIGAFHIAEQQVDGTSDYLKDGEWPIDNGIIEVYAAPPVPVVPEEKPMPNPLSMYAVDAVAAIAEVRGWNACRAAMLQSGNFRENKNSSTNNFREIAETSTNYPVIPSEVLSAIQKVAKIRVDFDDFDGDRRGIGDCLDEAEQELIVTINKYASQLAAEPIAPNDVREQTAIPQVPVTPDGWVIVPKKLTAENGAKGVLSGEFSETTFISCPECFGDDDCETCDGSGRIEIKVPVSWTTIKTIWAKGCEYFSIVAPQQDG